MSIRYFRFVELAAFWLLIYALDFRHVLISGPPKLLAILALAFLFSFVVGRKTQILKAVTLCFIPQRLISFLGNCVALWTKLHEELACTFVEPTLLPLFQRPPPIS